MLCSACAAVEPSEIGDWSRTLRRMNEVFTKSCLGLGLAMGRRRHIGPMKLEHTYTALVLSPVGRGGYGLGRHSERGHVSIHQQGQADFRLNDSERGTIRIKVTGNTRSSGSTAFGACATA